MRWSSDMALAHTPAAEPTGPAPAVSWRRRVLFFVPPIAFVGLMIAFTLSLDRDPGRLPSTLVGQPVPEFSLPPVQGRALGLASADLSPCHISIIGNYVVGGHVPIEVVNRLLAEKPAITGITLPGMPMGSPGMNGRKTAPFTIYEIAKGSRKVYAEV